LPADVTYTPPPSTKRRAASAIGPSSNFGSSVNTRSSTTTRAAGVREGVDRRHHLGARLRPGEQKPRAWRDVVHDLEKSGALVPLPRKPRDDVDAAGRSPDAAEPARPSAPSDMTPTATPAPSVPRASAGGVARQDGVARARDEARVAPRNSGHLDGAHERAAL
jgi:hypothetical protein